MKLEQNKQKELFDESEIIKLLRNKFHDNSDYFYINSGQIFYKQTIKKT